MYSLCSKQNLRPYKGAGFTLVEIIITLIILGIVVVIPFAAYLNSVRSHMDAKQNYAEAQKAQAAMMRITLEMQNASSITASNNIISYTYIPDSTKRTISLTGSNLNLHKESDKKDYALTDNLISETGFTASYSSNLLSLTLSVNLTNGSRKQFTTAIYTPE